LVLSRLTESELCILEGKIAEIFSQPDPYQHIKLLIIKHFERSGCLPSDSETNDTLLRRVFLDNLPVTFRHILVLQPISCVDQLASLADKLFFEQKADLLTNVASTSAETSSFREPSTKPDALVQIHAELKSLKADVTQLHNNSFRNDTFQHIPNSSQTNLGNKSYFSHMSRSEPKLHSSLPAPTNMPKKIGNFSKQDTVVRPTQSSFMKPNKPAESHKQNLCFYHTRFGANARNCSKGCEFQSPGTSSSDVAFCRTANMHSWSVFDPISQRNFVIDTGACRSLIAANNKERSSSPQSCLKAANGTDILVFGEKHVSLQIGNPLRNVTFSFLVTSLSHNLIGLDFIDYFQLILDVPNRNILFPGDTVRNGINNGVLHSCMNNVNISKKMMHVTPPPGFLSPSARQTHAEDQICDNPQIPADSDSTIPDDTVCSKTGSDGKPPPDGQSNVSPISPTVLEKSEAVTNLPHCTINEQLQRPDRFPRRQRYKQRKRYVDKDTWESLSRSPSFDANDSKTQSTSAILHASKNSHLCSNPNPPAITSNLNPLATPFINTLHFLIKSSFLGLQSTKPTTIFEPQGHLVPHVSAGSVLKKWTFFAKRWQSCLN